MQQHHLEKYNVVASHSSSFTAGYKQSYLRARTHTHTCAHARFHRLCTRSRLIRWLIWARWSVKSHVSRGGNTRAAAAVGGLGCGARPALQVLSVSRRRPPWLREAGQRSRFLCVFQHWRRQQLPAHITGAAAAAVAAAPESSPLSFHYREVNSFFLRRQRGKKTHGLLSGKIPSGKMVNGFVNSDR